MYIVSYYIIQCFWLTYRKGGDMSGAISIYVIVHIHRPHVCTLRRNDAVVMAFDLCHSVDADNCFFWMTEILCHCVSVNKSIDNNILSFYLSSTYSN